MIVCKFGGSSTAHLCSLKNIKKIKEAQEDRKNFVFSALGKSFEKDVKITDLLIEYANNISDDKYCKNIYLLICKKFNQFKKNIELKTNINKEIKKYIKIYKKNKNIEYLVSRGEFLTAKMMAKYLDIKFIPAEKLIFFKNNKINYLKIRKCLTRYIKKYKKIVTCGFYGIDEKGKIKLFSRGGGDITGAILSKCVNASIYENWTDVSGVRDVNPNIVKHNKQLYLVSYDELDIMTQCDANVIHNECVKILKNSDIQLQICNVFCLQDPKTISFKNSKLNNNFIIYKTKAKNVLIYIKSNKKIIYKNITCLDCKKSNFYLVKANVFNYKKIINKLYEIL